MDNKWTIIIQGSECGNISSKFHSPHQYCFHEDAYFFKKEVLAISEHRSLCNEQAIMHQCIDSFHAWSSAVQGRFVYAVWERLYISPRKGRWNHTLCICFDVNMPRWYIMLVYILAPCEYTDEWECQLLTLVKKEKQIVGLLLVYCVVFDVVESV